MVNVSLPPIPSELNVMTFPAALIVTLLIVIPLRLYSVTSETVSALPPTSMEQDALAAVPVPALRGVSSSQ